MMLETERHIRDTARAAILSIGLFVGAVMVLGGVVPLEGAVVTTGTITIDGNVKKVQHHTGGIIEQLLVAEGSRVKLGELIARLDATQARASLGVVASEIAAQRARLLRLLAERDDLPEMARTLNGHPQIASDWVAKPVIESEGKLLAARRIARVGQKTQIRERIAQIETELQGTEFQLRSTRQQLAIALEERQTLEPLRLQGLVQRQRLTALDREIARNEGIIGDARSRLEQARARIREANEQLAQVDRDRVAEASKDLREAETKLGELSERRLAAEDQLQRLDIRAPASGIVHEMAVHTIGGVVRPGEPLMLIVPDPQALIIEARVAPQDIDQIHTMQPARIRFTAFNQRVTPELVGQVFRISPNTTRDQSTGAAFYTIGLRLADGEVDKLNGAPLAPGMLAETFMTTSSRTALSFLLKPLSDNVTKVFAGR